MRTVLRSVTDPTGTKRVLIVRRDDDNYGFEVEQWSDDPSEKAWIQSPQRPFTICDSAETAWREALGRVEWLRKVADSDDLNA